jgi:hypothetical protein
MDLKIGIETAEFLVLFFRNKNVVGIVCPGADRILEPLTMLPMQKINFSTTTVAAHQMISAGKPSIPLTTRQPIAERKTSDPSSAFPKGERYPIPSFFEYRIKPREFDPL